jgi:hypothetical protein
MLIRPNGLAKVRFMTVEIWMKIDGGFCMAERERMRTRFRSDAKIKPHGRSLRKEGSGLFM